MNTTSPRPPRLRHARGAALAIALVASAAACSDGGGGSAEPTTSAAPAATTDAATPDTTANTTAVEPTEPATPDATEAAAPETTPAVLGELDDLDEDGSADERCGTADLGAGLVVEPLCNTALIPSPEEGVAPLPNSLLT
ncbi:MAG: hypothetical protein ABMA25_24065, partial [Ilumatobacteraceae bacterium]